MVYGRWCPKWVRGTGQAGQTSLAGWIRQGRSRGSICVYRITRVWDRRCSDTSATIALRLAPIRPPRRPVSRPASRAFTRPVYTTPPHPPLSAVFAQAANSARRERTRALQWAACLGTRAARRRGASVTTWCPARVLADGPRNARPSLPFFFSFLSEPKFSGVRFCASALLAREIGQLNVLALVELRWGYSTS